MVKGLHTMVYPVGESGGIPPENFLNFTPSETTSGAFQTIFGFQMT